MKKVKVTLFIVVFACIFLNLVGINSYCLSENISLPELIKNFTEKYGKEVRIRYDVSGRPIRIMNLNTAASDGKPEDIALSFLSENELFLGINSANLKFIKCRETKEVKTVIFQQIYKNLPVQDKVVRINLTQNGKIIFLKSKYFNHADLNIVPKITPYDAAAIVKNDLGIEKLVQVIKKVTWYGSSKDELSTPVPELVVIPTEEKGKASLAWKFHFNPKGTSHCWYYGIDAHTGEIIVKIDTTRDWSIYGNVDGNIYPNDGEDGPSPEELENLVVEAQYYYYGWCYSGSSYTNSSGNYSFSYPSNYLYHRILAGTVGSKCITINDYTDLAAVQTKGDWYPYIPSPQDFDLNYNPSTSYSYFDCVNAYYHINKSLEEYYEDNWGYDLGYIIYIYTHYYHTTYGNDYAAYFYLPNPYIVLGHGAYYYNNAAHARDIMLHELQHAITDEIYYPNLGSDDFINALNEAYSDYFAASQTNDPNQGEWYCNDPNMIRDLSNHMADPNWDTISPIDDYNNSLVISHAFWHIRTALEQSEADDIIWCSLLETPDDWDDLYNALLCEDCNPSYHETVEDILETHWGGFL